MIRILPSVLSPAECRRAIAAAETHGFEAMGPRYPDGYRNNDRLVVDDPALAARLFETLKPALPRRFRPSAGSEWSLDGLNPRFRFCRYRDGQQFTRHRDGAWAQGNRRSWLTVMLYLNDASEFDGGATRFDDREVPPRAGQAIVFDHRLWHDGAPVTRGTKYVMRTDVMYACDGAADVAPERGSLTRERVVAGHTGYVWVVRAATDGSVLSGSRDGTLRRDGSLVRAEAGSITALLEIDGAVWTGGRHGRLSDGRRSWAAHDGVVLALERRDDGAVRSCGADGTVRLWSPAGEAMGVESKHAGWVWGVGAIEPVTCRAGEAFGDRQGFVSAGAARWKAHAGAVLCVAALRDGWISGGEDGAVRVWSRAGTLRAEGRHGDFVTSVAVLGYGRCATGSYDGTVAVWVTGH